MWLLKLRQVSGVRYKHLMAQALSLLLGEDPGMSDDSLYDQVFVAAQRCIHT